MPAELMLTYIKHHYVFIYQHFNMKIHVSDSVFNFQLVLFLHFFPWDVIIGSLLVKLLSPSLTGPAHISLPYDSVGAVN